METQQKLIPQLSTMSNGLSEQVEKLVLFLKINLCMQFTFLMDIYWTCDQKVHNSKTLKEVQIQDLLHKD